MSIIFKVLNVYVSLWTTKMKHTNNTTAPNKLLQNIGSPLSFLSYVCYAPVYAIYMSEFETEWSKIKYQYARETYIIFLSPEWIRWCQTETNK